MQKRRWLLWVGLCAGLLHCSKDNQVTQNNAVDVGGQCAESSDCGPSAVCALGFCRQGCTTDSECPQGSLCIGDRAPYGCTLPVELACSSSMPCDAPLTCGIDGKCRMPCSQDADCPRNEQSCKAGTCVSTAEPNAEKTWFSCEDGRATCGDPHISGGGDVTSLSSRWSGNYVTDIWACNVTEPGLAKVSSCAQGSSCIIIRDDQNDVFPPACCSDTNCVEPYRGSYSASCNTAWEACRAAPSCKPCVDDVIVGENPFKPQEQTIAMIPYACFSDPLFLTLGTCGGDCNEVGEACCESDSSNAFCTGGLKCNPSYICENAGSGGTGGSGGAGGSGGSSGSGGTDPCDALADCCTSLGDADRSECEATASAGEASQCDADLTRYQNLSLCP
ncbi:MAG: hypothetical protein H6718_07595 [Polyangiaceae bacterium]|nr:hypothetical protein [Myxococcales bacterium]MCB9585245.1 hypothetical protein [Polyangiaceae bacterium]MCB9609971.1 hypothetical protein [Polyangiaceae bacterium]